MAILIGIWEAVLALAIVITLATLVLWWYWRQRLVNIRQTWCRERKAELARLRKEFASQFHIEMHNIISDFRHQASHCVRPIKDSLYLLRRKMKGQAYAEPLADSLALIEHYEWRLTRLIENMELVSRLEVPEHAFHFSEVKLDAIVSDVVEGFGNLDENDGTTVVWWAKPEDFPFVPGNPNGLRQVFINLVDNAIKYSGEKGEVDISLEADESRGMVYAQVSDTGPGIPQEDLEHIFDRGYRVEDARGRPPKEVGQGLGLYIAKLIVEKHRGSINVTSELGRGTTFTIALPMQRM